MRRPVFIANQARNAEGPLGRLIAFIMARETWAQNKRAIEALQVSPRDHVLDVGCGPGRSLSLLTERAPDGRVVGADPSELMAKVAAKRARRAEVVIASAASLPFEEGAFDKALCVHVVYFWKDLAAAFAEIARVLKPGGRLALLFRTNADEKAVQAFPTEVYRFPSLTEVIASLEAAGFAVQGQNKLFGEPATAPLLLICTRRTTPVAGNAPQGAEATA